jgi:uncharacterized membrane protein
VSAHRDLRAIVLAAVVLATAALVVPVGWLSLLLLAPLAFFLTGYAIVLAAFVENAQPWPRAFWFSLGFSLAVLALLPLPLNYLGGMTPATWAIALVLVVLVACGVAAGRRPADWPDDGLGLRAPKLSPVTALLGVGALALVAGAIVLAHVPLANSKAEGFVELSLRPVHPPAGGTLVRIGVGNEEHNYTGLRVRTTFPGNQVVRREIALPPGRTTTFDLNVTPEPTPGNPTFVSVVLYRPGETGNPYRRVYAWIPAAPTE